MLVFWITIILILVFLKSRPIILVFVLIFLTKITLVMWFYLFTRCLLQQSSQSYQND